MPDTISRIALITGANQGVGFQVAKELVAAGLTVLLGSRNPERGEAAAAEIGAGAIPLQIDVTDDASIAAAADRIRSEFGRLDLLVNNAAISQAPASAGLTPDDTLGANAPSRLSIDDMRTVWDTNGFGYRAYYSPIYPASKAALNAVALAMMIELEATDIKVNLVSPAFTATALNGFAGVESVEDGSREVVRVALLGADGPTGTFTRWQDQSIPW